MPHTFLTRRAFTASLAGLAVSVSRAAAPKPGLTLGFSTYGMPKMAIDRALTVVADTGFDSVEIAILPDRDASPERLDAARRRAIRKLLDDRRLKLTALMENLPPSADAKVNTRQVARLTRAAELANDLGAKAPPLIETVLGGGKWETARTLYRDRLGAWLEVLSKHRIVLAIKPHRFGAMSLPEHAIWLIQQLKDSPWLRLVFDHSHYALRGKKMEALVREAAPYTAFVAVKDVVERGGKTVFDLPGAAGTIDHARLFGLLSEAGYRGDINCEVSGMVFNRPGYDPVVAARTCHRNMLAALVKAGLRTAK